MNTTLAIESELNLRVARANRAAFALQDLTVVSLIGPPGSGKTTVIEAIAHRLHNKMEVAALIANPAPTRDVDRLNKQGVRATGVQTYNLTSSEVRDSLADLDLHHAHLLFIESAGVDPLPGDLDLGEELRVAVFSVAGGDDKAAEYAHFVSESDLVLLSKIDLLPFVDFNLATFAADVARIHPTIETLNFSPRIGCGVAAFEHWLVSRRSSEGSVSVLARDDAEWVPG